MLSQKKNRFGGNKSPQHSAAPTRVPRTKNTPTTTQQDGRPSSSATSPCVCDDSSSPSSRSAAEHKDKGPVVTFSLHRPLGAPQGTLRLTLHGAGGSSTSSSGCWALSRPWTEVGNALRDEISRAAPHHRRHRSDGRLCLELAAGNHSGAWDRLDRVEGSSCSCWDRDVVQPLMELQHHQSQRGLSSVRFLSGIRGDQQASLLRGARPEKVEFHHPREYDGVLDALTACTTEVNLFHGAALDESACRTLARWLPTARKFLLEKTSVSNKAAFVVLFEALEASVTLEEVVWDPCAADPDLLGAADDGDSSRQPRWESVTRYLEVAARFNALRRVGLPKQPAVAHLLPRGGPTNPCHRQRQPQRTPCPIEAAVEVLREWWRSTHRPPMPPTAQHADGDLLGGCGGEKINGRTSEPAGRDTERPECY